MGYPSRYSRSHNTQHSLSRMTDVSKDCIPEINELFALQSLFFTFARPTIHWSQECNPWTHQSSLRGVLWIWNILLPIRMNTGNTERALCSTFMVEINLFSRSTCHRYKSSGGRHYSCTWDWLIVCHYSCTWDMLSAKKSFFPNESRAWCSFGLVFILFRMECGQDSPSSQKTGSIKWIIIPIFVSNIWISNRASMHECLL
jgi:hypothetical protein